MPSHDVGGEHPIGDRLPLWQRQLDRCQGDGDAFFRQAFNGANSIATVDEHTVESDDALTDAVIADRRDQFVERFAFSEGEERCGRVHRELAD